MLIIVGLGCVLYPEYRLESHDWTPLTMPIFSGTGEIQSPVFRPDYGGLFVVKLAFDPKQIEREECFVGDFLYNKACEALGSGLDLELERAPGRSDNSRER